LTPGAELPFDEAMSCPVYFVDRDPNHFKYVLEFLSNEQTKLPNNLPPYKDAPILWKNLKQEADFFCLQGLALILREKSYIHSCSPDLGEKDILYWLGTRQGKAEYQNPLWCHQRGYAQKSLCQQAPKKPDELDLLSTNR
jgi:hypothetical protein